MKHIAIDQQTEQVREFIPNLPIEPNGVELELEGRVICKSLRRNGCQTRRSRGDWNCCNGNSCTRNIAVWAFAL
jgi:hypothetical protein